MELVLGLLALGAGLTAGVLALRLAAARAHARRSERTARSLEQRARELEEGLARARDANARFLGSVTHEMRTPLTAIMGYQELLAEGLYGDIDERCREPVMRIGSAAADLLRMIDGALEMARLDADRLQLRLAPVDLAAACRDAADTLADMARDRNTRIHVRMPDDLPGLITDPDRLARALELALTGAVHASLGSTITLAASKDGAGALVEIIGMPPAAADADAGTDLGSVGGSAAFRIGLAQRFVRALGGDLVLTGTETGTATATGTAPRLRIRLPLKAPATPPTPPPAH